MFLNRSMKNFRILFIKESKLPSSKVGFLKFLNRKPILCNKSEFKLVYCFNYVPFIAAVLKSKISIPVVSFISLPFFYFYDESHVSPFLMAVTGALYFCMGIGTKKFAQNLIGKIYVNKEGDMKNLIVSSVDGNGNRVDRIHKMEDFINNDFPNKFMQYLGFTIITIENTDILYKLNIPNGKFIDPYVCDILLGRIWSPKMTEKLRKGANINEKF